MEIKVTILPESESVYLLSGSFLEEPSFCIDSDEVLYLTVLPLNAALLPYTVKLIGNKVASDKALAFIVKTGENEYVLRLGRRRYVYNEGHFITGEDICCKFFYFVKGGHFNFASELLTSELRAGLSDRAIEKFFSEFCDIVKVKDKYYLSGDDGVGKLCRFSLADGKIDNITIE